MKSIQGCQRGLRNITNPSFFKIATIYQKTPQEFEWCVTLNCQASRIVMNSGSQLSELYLVSQMSQASGILYFCVFVFIFDLVNGWQSKSFGLLGVLRGARDRAEGRRVVSPDQIPLALLREEGQGSLFFVISCETSLEKTPLFSPLYKKLGPFYKNSILTIFADQKVKRSENAPDN